MAELLASGLKLPESPRWHDGAFWFSDIWGGRVYRIDRDGTLDVVAECTMPSGLGWLPDGTMLVVAMADQAVLRVTGNGLTPYADLSALAAHWCNDLIVDARGYCYVGCTGGEPSNAPVVPAPLIGIAPGGEPFLAASDLYFPNGMAITRDGDTLFVAETGAGRISAFPIAANGRLGESRLHARLKGRWPDGIDIDSYDSLWVADPRGGALVRVTSAGDIDRMIVIDGIPIACAIGGPDADQLLVCAAERLALDDMAGMNGRIELHRLSTATQP